MLDVETLIIHHQLWGYKAEEKLHLGSTQSKKVEYHCSKGSWQWSVTNYKITMLDIVHYTLSTIKPMGIVQHNDSIFLS
jgi:hypothetical protein